MNDVPDRIFTTKDDSKIFRSCDTRYMLPLDRARRDLQRAQLSDVPNGDLSMIGKLSPASNSKESFEVRLPLKITEDLVRYVKSMTATEIQILSSREHETGVKFS